MPSFLSKLRRRPAHAPQPREDERDLIAFVNEARTDAQRQRVIRAARRRASARR